MQYIEIDFTVKPLEPAVDILIAELGELPFDSFQETENGCLAYIPAKDFDEARLQEVVEGMSEEFMIAYAVNEQEDINWNAEWEKNYEAVMIADKVFIHAPFHEAVEDVDYNILIEPKMSFGTAHHPTTAQVIQLLLKEEMQGKFVMDMGAGTAVLAILARKMGAASVVAVDNDEWAYRNAQENVNMNACSDIGVHLGDATWLNDQHYDLFIANINRNILLQDMQTYAAHIQAEGTLLLSGFYEHDLEAITEECAKHGLSYHSHLADQEWVAARFVKA